MKARKQVQERNMQEELILSQQLELADKDEEKDDQKMRNVENDEEECKTVAVGIKMDSESRELLTWALVKVAAPGDCVIALHIIPSSKDSSVIDVKSSSSLLSMVKAFDAVLAVYEGFCNLRQIELKMKICRGSSIRKLLVQEAKSYEATRLILGVAKNGRGIGYSPTSIARYCAKRLPENCSVLAVNNGKIVFEKEALLSTQHAAKQLTIECVSNGQDQLARKSTASRLSVHSSSSITSSSSSSSSGIGIDNDGTASHNYLPSNSVENEYNNLPHTVTDNNESMVPAKKAETSICELFHNMPEEKPGWPLLRKTVMCENKNATARSTKISVVQWALQLPDRHSAASTVTPVKSDVEVPTENRSTIAATTKASDAFVPGELILGEGKKFQELEYLREKYSSLCRIFSYQELIEITNNFTSDNLVGEGGSSRVYKGCLSDGKELAVKIVNSSEDPMSEFVAEIEIVTSLHHKNVASLFGFCFEDDKLILIYEFLSRGSLEENLHGGGGQNMIVLSWAARYKVAVGIAKALSYLHGAGNDKPVIHGDVKSSNILLNDECDPQLSDFGLAKWAASPTMPLTCHNVAGTFGYLAPEYFMYGKVNEMIDVYAYGVVLLELLSGRKPVSTGCPKGQESLVMWATYIVQGGMTKLLIDPCIVSDIDEDHLQRFTLAAFLCIRHTPQSRPRMEVVLKLLQGDEETLKWAIQEVHSAEDEAANTKSNIQSHINLALLNIDDDDTVSVSSTEPVVDFLTANKSLEEYLQGRWSRSSSFD